MAERRFDFVIAGAGLAGLTLAAALARRFPERTLLLVDPLADRVGASPTDHEQVFDRTLGFWAEGTPPFAPLVERSWTRLRVDGPGGPHTLELGRRRYHWLRWSKLRDHLLAELCERPGIELCHGRVTDFVTGAGANPGLVAIVNGEAIAARFGFDSRLPLAQLHRAPGRVLAWQSFCGLRIEVETPRFDPEQATFMDLRPSTPSRFAFLNVLPESSTSALVYHVEIGPPQTDASMRAAVEADLRELVGLAHWRVQGQEAGRLPLGDQRYIRRVDQVRRIGVAGGRLKPSTGYAFTRILADNDEIVRSLAEHGHPFAIARERRRFRFLDGVLLDVLDRAPQLGPALFMGMFRRCEPSTVFALLDERASLAQLFAIMAAMPHKPTMALAGLRRALAWLRAPGAVALPPGPAQAALEE